MRNERQIVVQDISPEKVRGRILAIRVAQVDETGLKYLEKDVVAS
jgi:hypothetical protein